MLQGGGLLSYACKYAVGVGMLVAAASPISAQESQSDDQWKFKAAVYLWGAAIDGTTQAGSDLDIPFSDLWDNLNFAFMGAFEARKEKWSAAADVIYMDVSADKSGTISPFERLPSITFPASANVEMTGWVVNLNGARNVYDGEHASVDLLIGARYLYLDNKLTANVANLPSSTVDATDSTLDAVAGVKGNIKLSKSWFLPYHLDIGTGQSDFTWQGFGGVGYSFKPVDVVLGYRYIYWDFDSSSDFDNLSFSGPLLGAAFKF